MTKADTPTRVEQVVIRDVPLRQAVREYLEHCKARDLSVSAIDSRRRSLDNLMEVCGAMKAHELSTVEVTATLARATRGETQNEFLKRLARDHRAVIRKGRSQDSVNVDRSALRNFTEWLKASRYMSVYEQPTYGLRNTKKRVSESRRKQDRWVLAPEQFGETINLARQRHERDAFVVALGLYCCRRVSEIMQMRVGDINIEAETFSFTDVKGGGEKVTLWYGWSSEFSMEVRRWLNFYVRQAGPLDPNWYLVPARIPPGQAGFTAMHPGWAITPDQPSHESTLRNDVCVALTLMGAAGETGVGMHTLRHSGARAVEALNWDRDDIQDLLNHKQASTTSLYLTTNKTVDRWKAKYGQARSDGEAWVFTDKDRRRRLRDVEDWAYAA